MDERLAAANWAKPEVASMNMGSLNSNISGFEDNLGRGELVTSNGAQVAKSRGILEGLSLEIAMLDEARQLLQTKNKRAVGF